MARVKLFQMIALMSSLRYDFTLMLKSGAMCRLSEISFPLASEKAFPLQREWAEFGKSVAGGQRGTRCVPRVASGGKRGCG